MIQQFCLKWDNYMSNMMVLIKDFLSTEAMVDVTLACDGLSLKAHKLILSACSPFFKSLFLENPCKHPIVILKDVKYTELKAIIEFMYHGEVNIAPDQLTAVMKAAEILRVKGLGEITIENDQSGDESQNHSGDESSHQLISDIDIPLKQGSLRSRKQSESDQSDNGAFDLEINHPDSDMEELPDDMDSYTFDTTASPVPFQSHSTNSLHKSQQDQLVKLVVNESFATEEKFGLVSSESQEQTLTEDDLPRRSSRSSLQSNTELQKQSQSTADHSSNLVAIRCTPMSSNTLVVDNQQSGSPPASHKKLQKKIKLKKTQKKSMQQQSNLEKEENNGNVSYTRIIFDKVENAGSTNRTIKKYDIVDENITPTSRGKHHKSHRCRKCDFKTACFQSLKRHISTVHEKKKSFFCDECDYKAALSQHLKRHISTVHEKKKLYPCNLCDYESSQECNLQRHIKIVHERAKPYKCQKCNYRASQKVSVIKHFNDIHLKLKFFACASCEYQTSRKENLLRHLKIHGEKKKV